MYRSEICGRSPVFEKLRLAITILDEANFLFKNFNIKKQLTFPNHTYLKKDRVWKLTIIKHIIIAGYHLVYLLSTKSFSLMQPEWITDMFRYVWTCHIKYSFNWNISYFFFCFILNISVILKTKLWVIFTNSVHTEVFCFQLCLSALWFVLFFLFIPSVIVLI